MHAHVRRKILPTASEDKKPGCFRSDQRFFCRQKNCPLRRDCMKLVAEWLR